MFTLSPTGLNDLGPPTVPAALPDIPGGATNLIPVSATAAPLRIEFPMWQNSDPQPGFSETVTLHWGGTTLEKSWTAPVPADDLFIMVPVALLVDGPYVVHYVVTTWNGNTGESGPLTLTIDKTAPVLASIQRLIFPTEVISNGVTAGYLTAHDDKVMADVPGYSQPGAGDEVTWFWDATSGSHDRVDTYTLTQTDIGRPLAIAFEGSMIRSRGDGPRQAYYQVRDRAGNLSPYADAVTLETRVVVRDLNWPDVDGAVGSGEQITLVPERAAAGAIVIVPDTAVIYPGETIWAQWGEPGASGSYRTSTPAPPGSRRYAIPKEHVAQHIGSRLPVSYDIVGPSNSYTSAIRRLQVLALDPTRLPLIQVTGLAGSRLSLANIPDSGVPLQLGTWTLMATTQRVRIQVAGVAATGQPVETVVMDDHQVTAPELVSGITASIGRDFMYRLKLDTKFSIKVFVSFNEGATWPSVPNFPVNDDITLVA
ncbi:hypothetical protein J3P77_08955 [Pseudomonas sp. R1-18]|uniref:hypothetical protein n=1 Tax=Pseudomonas sp. R1-18 TaxID=1632772 RepID=UPI003DA9F044